jgi:hypothetical protein
MNLRSIRAVWLPCAAPDVEVGLADSRISQKYVLLRSPTVQWLFGDVGRLQTRAVNS